MTKSLVRDGRSQERGGSQEKNLPEIGKPVDTEDGQVLFRVIAVWNLVDVMVPPAGSQKRPPVSERFRSLWVHGHSVQRRRFIWAVPRSGGPVLETQLEFI